MQRIAATAILALLGWVALGAEPGAAAPPQPLVLAQAAGAPEPLLRDRPRRARPHIRVHPRYPYRRHHSLYPLHYPFESPGPNAVRRCLDWYATEHRPSGTVVVPRMRCWWERG